MRLALVLLFFSLNTFAAVISPSESCRCAYDQVSDPFEEPIRFDFGEYRFRCVDSCRFRRAIRIRSQDRVLRVANVLHAGKYRIAEIPLDGVESVDILFEEFLPRISHVALRFNFSDKKPLRLLQQGAEKQDPATSRSIVLSVEGVPPKDEPYSFFDSAVGRYLLAYRLQTIEETYDFMVKRKKHHVTQSRLTLDPKTAAVLLRESVRASEEKSFQSVYGLFTNNCATGALSLIDAERPVADSWIAGLERALPINFVYGTLEHLRARKLVKDEGVRLPDLETEFAN